jgi:hypothetical protein
MKEEGVLTGIFLLINKMGEISMENSIDYGNE